MDETLGDGPLRQPHDGKDRLGRWRRARSPPAAPPASAIELRRLQPARGDAAARECEVGDRGHARARARPQRAIRRRRARRQSPSRRPARRPRGSVRRRSAAEFGCGLTRHRPIRVGARDDVPRPPRCVEPSVEASVSLSRSRRRGRRRSARSRTARRRRSAELGPGTTLSVTSVDAVRTRLVEQQLERAPADALPLKAGVDHEAPDVEDPLGGSRQTITNPAGSSP